MLRVTTLYASSAASTAAYYTQYLTQTPDEPPGVWAGRQADALGLSGDVTPEALEALLSGCHPIGGGRLGNALVDRTLADGRVVRAVAGFDATFSAPKSVSVLWALTGDAGLLAAHDAAVRVALAHLERYGSTTRVRSNGGRLHLDTVGLSMATFRQTTSRADDPQLHSHAVISAKVQTAEGRWLALDARYLKRHQRMLGGLYQSALRAELTHRFGVAWGTIENGQAEIAGAPAELLEVFSKRTAQVDAALDAKLSEFRDRQGREPTRWERAALSREAAVDTRAHKTGNGTGDLPARWLNEAAEAGYQPVEMVRSVRQASRDQAREKVPRMTVEGIVDALSASGSTWNRAEVMRAISDTQRPLPNMAAEGWATALERAVDQVIQTCVDLDPDGTGSRRASDGRSVWLEPTSPHVTSPAVLAEEEHVLSWAIDAQLDDPRPSVTVNAQGLDVLQADVAAAVAGTDRLVLAVGPAGAGKTTTLRAAADDLTAQGRPMFGVAPSARAARVLQRDTGIGSDTLAKLLYEWNQHRRPPGPAWQLPVGATVIVDEAGMVGTPSLAQLARLADAQRWRVVLTGDPYQLQAVGRGGLFAELCATGRTHHLERIHRFTNRWEAAASLQLRHGDPNAIDVYESHDRIVADTFDGHVDRITRIWLDTTTKGGTVAITASTNAHVDAINTAVQTARLATGQLDTTTAPAAIGGGEQAYVGDAVVTRRNDRQLTTTDGEPVRNREQWTVATVHGDGSLTVSSGTGRVTLPVEYVTEHVRLGYAATEHGNQGDTTSIGIQLATPATTRRGLYVGATRGRETNLILTVTPTGDPAEARDVLDGILASDRADIPATAQRRTLAETARSVREPRCAIPAWFNDLKTTVRERLADAAARTATDAEQLADIESRLSEARRRLDAATRTRAPYQPALDEAAASVQHARERQWAANAQLRQAGRLQRRSARTAVEQADRNYHTAVEQQQRLHSTLRPILTGHSRAANRVRDIEASLGPTRQLIDLAGHHRQAERLQHVAVALDDWHNWANGHPVDPNRLRHAIRVLQHPAAADLWTACHTLANTLRPAITIPSRQPTSPEPAITRVASTPDMGIGL